MDICWGLKRRGPRAPFIFLFVAESLSGLTRETSVRGRSGEIELGNGGIWYLVFNIHMIHYWLRELRIIWVVKAVLKWFDVPFGIVR